MSDSAHNQVLLIEDNPGDADLVRLRLVEGDAGVNINCVSRLAEGLDSLSKVQPSVVLLDLNLPDCQGADTFRKVLDKAPGVPIVILSGHDDEALAMKAVHQGVQDYLVKGSFTSKQLERAMRYAVERQAMLRSLEISRKQQLEFKNKFLNHVSHELRTPLTCIHQFVSLLLDDIAGELNVEQRFHLATVMKSVNQLNAMIRDLLQATRAETGKIRVEQRCVSVVDAVSNAVTMLQAMAREKCIGLEMGLDTRIPFVYADPDRVLEILINLVDNAIKFTPAEGSVMVKACMVEADSDFVYVSVADTGRGISPEARALIFERLYQDPDSIDDSRKGLGLGLYIAKELVELQGGRMWVVSEPGAGSTFSFTLPVYSLPKLLSPVITRDGQLRDALVLVSVELKPLKARPRGNWRETQQACLETLRRCVYLDKDVVLPPMGNAGAEETFFVVASTDMDRVEVMLTRIREQVGLCGDLSTTGILKASAMPILLSPAHNTATLDERVQAVSDTVTEMVMRYLGPKQNLQLKGSMAND
jgi:sigma-B regulation protein RsbU (phosphoserine phosphatase)